MSKVRVTFDLDLATGDYEVQYNNAGAPGSPIDLTRTLAVLKSVLLDHEADVEEDAVSGRSGQARVVRS